MGCGKCCKCDKCGKGAGWRGLCPVSFGLAIGIVAFFAVFIWSIWIMRFGMPPMMVQHMAPPTLSSSVVHALWALFKGFLFGFFVALIYDALLCCKRCCWKRSGDEKCECGSSCSPEKKV